jgi:hypothetical protein
MKKAIYRCVLFLGLLGVASFPLFGQQAKKILTVPVMDRFIKDYAAMSADFERLGVEFEGIEDPTLVASYLDVMKTNKDARSVLTKYGWNEIFYVQLAAILYGYASLVLEEEIATNKADIDEAYASLDSNTALNTEQKKLMRDQMDLALGQVDQLRRLFRDGTHPDDYTLVQRYRDKLDITLDMFED